MSNFNEDTDWDKLDDAMANKLSITDVSFVSDKKKGPRDYDVVSLPLISTSIRLVYVDTLINTSRLRTHTMERRRISQKVDWDSRLAISATPGSRCRKE